MFPPLNPSDEFLANCPVLTGIEIWKDKDQDGYAVSAEADEALTRFFGRAVRLVRKGPTPRRLVGKLGDPELVLNQLGDQVEPPAVDLEHRSVRFQDFLPFLITTDASLEHLRQSLLRSVYPTDTWSKSDIKIADQLSRGEYEVRSWSLPLAKIDKSLWTCMFFAFLHHHAVALHVLT